MDKNVIIRKLKLVDLPSVIKLNKSASKKERLGYHFILKNIFVLFFSYLFKKIRFFVVEYQVNLIGYAFITHFKKNNLVIMVKEPYQGRGLGKRLMNSLLRGQKDTYLTVEKSNEIAINLYKKMGFEVCKEILMMKKP